MLHRNGYNGPHALIEPRLNCRLGRVMTEPGSSLLAAELLLTKALLVNETIIIEYDVINAETGALATGVEREFRVPVACYVVEVCFHPDALPVRCLQYSRIDGSPEVVTDARLGPANSVHGVVVDFGPGIFGLQWEWED